MHEASRGIKFPSKRLKFLVSFPKQSEIRNISPDTLVSFVPMPAVSERGLVDTSQSKPLSEVSQGYTYFRDGDVVVAKITPCFENGKGALAQGLSNGIAFGTTELTVIRANATLDPRFLYYFTVSDYFRRLGEAEMYGAGGQKRVPDSFVRDILFPEVPKTVQSTIADFLDTETAKSDGLVAKYERLIELIEEKRVALIAHAVAKGLDPNASMKNSSVDWIGEIPSHWRVLRNKVLFQERDERSSTGSEELLSVSHLTGVTPRSGKSVTMFMAESLEGYKRCFKGDFVINTMWAWMGAMGITPCDGIVSPSYNVYRVREPDVLDAHYYDLLSRTPSHVAKVTSVSTGIWESRLRLYPQAFFDIKTAVPPLAEQRAIVAHVQREMQRYEALALRARKAISLLEEHRSALITAAVTGQIDVRAYKAKDIEEVVA